MRSGLRTLAQLSQPGFELSQGRALLDGRGSAFHEVAAAVAVANSFSDMKTYIAAVAVANSFSDMKTYVGWQSA